MEGMLSFLINLMLQLSQLIPNFIRATDSVSHVESLGRTLILQNVDVVLALTQSL